MTLWGKYDVQSTLFCFAVTKTVSVCSGGNVQTLEEASPSLRNEILRLTYPDEGKGGLKQPDDATAFQASGPKSTVVKWTVLTGQAWGVEGVKETQRRVLSTLPCLCTHARNLWLSPFPS